MVPLSCLHAYMRCHGCGFEFFMWDTQIDKVLLEGKLHWGFDPARPHVKIDDVRHCPRCGSDDVRKFDPDLKDLSPR